MYKTHRRYHYKIYFPPNLPTMVLKFFSNFNNLIYSQHALIQMHVDQRGKIPQITYQDLINPNNKLIEIYEIIYGNQRTSTISKVVVRCFHLSEQYDYSYVVSMKGIVISSWANDKNDTHRLDHKYQIYYKPKVSNEINTINRKNMVS